MTLGSLFDGLGTWQLAARRADITPLWSSEIEPFCLKVTARHFPNTIQLGDINGIEDAPHVDIITASTPCQDLSIAGKRGCLTGERSGLFFKAIKLVRRINPGFFVWENVPGAFSSNGGLDFKTVIEEILQEPVPLPEHGWSNAGLVDGRRSQIAWRVCDAQFWGVPQRRKRIFLVADFTGRRAAEILFEPESVRRNSAPCQSSQQNPAARTRTDSDCAVYENHGQDSRITRLGDIAPTVSAKYGTGGNNVPLVAMPPPLHLVLGATLSIKDATPSSRRQSNENFNPLTARGAAACATPSIVRRLTPIECERLMGLPDNWSADGSDSACYKALGNGVALPICEFILRRIKEACHETN